MQISLSKMRNLHILFGLIDKIMNLFKGIFKERINKDLKMKLVSNLIQLNEISNINCGGCGFSAIAIYRFLESQGLYTKKLNMTCLYCWDDKDDYEKNLENRGNGWDLYIPAHISLRFGKKLIDSNGYGIKKEKRYIYEHEATVEDIERMVRNASNWNWAFDRDKCIPEIENIMNVKLNDLL